MFKNIRYLSIVIILFGLGFYLQIIAQPTMMNPAAMSLLPRQDSSVSPRTLVVRTIKTNFQNNLQAIPVKLYRFPNHEHVISLKTDPSGRAEFLKLNPGQYIVEATFEQETLVSKPIEITDNDQAGYRMLLVFQPLTQEGKKPTEQASTDAQKESTKEGASTDAQKESTKEGASTDAQKESTKEGASADAQKESAKLGTSNHLFIAPNSYILLLFQSDDVLEVHEEIFLQNPLPIDIDPGPYGLKIPIEEHAQRIEVFSHAQDSDLSVEQPDPNEPAYLLWKSPIPPGTHLFEISFVLTGKHKFQFQQHVSLPWQSPALLMEHQDHAALEGEGFSIPFPMNTPQFKQLMGYIHSTDLKPDSSLSFTITLNSPFPFIPVIFGTLATLTLLICWIIAYQKQNSSHSVSLEELLQKRDQLLEKLAALPSTEIQPTQKEVLELVEVYKQIEKEPKQV